MPFISFITSFNVFELFSYFDCKNTEANFCTGNAMVVSNSKDLSKDAIKDATLLGKRL